ncbi:MAG: hypothetical protein IPI22_03930 [Bacteroidetes bacterium]|nr:hypothetical protein [Bacteroidota bacterium]
MNSFGVIRNVPATYLTIQSALNSCAANDTVLVAPGVYYEHIVWPVIQNIQLLSSGDSSNTFIDGSNNGKPLYFYGLNYNMLSMGANTLIKGFTIRNGYGQNNGASGGGIFVYLCTVTFDAISVVNNHISTPNFGNGAGINFKESKCIIQNSNISCNYIDTASWVFGAGIYCEKGETIISNCIVSNNQSGDGGDWYYGSGVYVSQGICSMIDVDVRNNIMGDNGSWYGGAISLNDCKADIMNVKIHANKQGHNGSWYYCAGMSIRGSDVNLTNALIDSNVNGTGGNWYLDLEYKSNGQPTGSRQIRSTSFIQRSQIILIYLVTVLTVKAFM